MKLIFGLAAVAGFASSTVSAYATFKHHDSNNVVPDRWIVELSSVSAFSKRGEDDHLDPHDRFHSHMKRAGVNYDVVSTFNSSYLLGASISVSDSEIDSVQAMPSVMAVYPVRLVPRPEPYAKEVSRISGPAANPRDTFSTHQMTGVDRLHELGVYGAGVSVAVIDTGIDYTHPALGGCFGPGCKVAKGYDLVGDDYNGTNTPVPDDDPMDCNGHGSHCAGIVAAGENPYGFVGVAPQATLGAYRIFGCTGSAANDVIIPAMIRAAEDGADVISMSIGGPAGWTEDVLSVLAQRLVESGIVVSISQGNSGDEGLYYTSSPASGLGVISVSSVDNIVTPAMVGFISSDPATPVVPIVALEFDPPLDTPLPIFFPSDYHACSPIDTDLAGQLVIAQRGDCPFAVKAGHVLKAGGSTMLIYNNATGPVTRGTARSYLVGANITSAFITLEAGEKIVSAHVADPSITMTFPDSYYNIPNLLTPGLVSTYTSYGPTLEGYFKPSVAAPGRNILSTWPLALGGYTVISGTSMACPFISGVAALMISTNGKMDPIALRSILQTTANPILTATNSSTFNTIAEQGAGLVDAFAAVYHKTVVSPGEIPLNDTLNAVNSFNVSISNYGKHAATYRLSNIPAQAGLTFSDEGRQPNLLVPLVDGAAELYFSDDYIEVRKGETVDVEISVAGPQGLDPKTVPVFSGFVQVEEVNGTDVMTIPYLGTAASLYYDFPILDTTDEVFGFNLPALVDSVGNILGFNSTESFPSFTFVDGDAPELVYRLIGGSAVIHFDLLPADTAFVPATGSGGWGPSGKITERNEAPDVGSVGRLVSSTYNYRNGHTEADYAASGNETLYFNVPLSPRKGDGLFFANGEKVPNAAYKLLVRALKFFGDVSKEADYETWLSSAFQVNQH